MTAQIVKLKFPRKWESELNDRHYVARTTPTMRKSRSCTMCGGNVRRSWKTGILWPKCGSCRYLIFLYGPSIEVTRIEE